MGIEPRKLLLTTKKFFSELKLKIVLKLKVLERSDPLYFGLDSNGEVTASVPPEEILLELTKDYKITIRITN